ncbi:MAG: hypothetical protein R3C28_10115 [Pirellulaceae bacterium]
MAILVHRNDEVLSAAVRRWNGQVYAATERHEQLWDPTQKVSSGRRIILPVLDRSQQQGQVETPSATLPKAVTGVPQSRLLFLRPEFSPSCTFDAWTEVCHV